MARRGMLNGSLSDGYYNLLDDVLLTMIDIDALLQHGKWMIGKGRFHPAALQVIDCIAV